MSHRDNNSHHKTLEERNGYPKIYFSGNNIDPWRTTQLIDEVAAQAAEQKAEMTTKSRTSSGMSLKRWEKLNLKAVSSM